MFFCSVGLFKFKILNRFILNDLKSSLSIEINSLVYHTNIFNNRVVINNKFKLSLHNVLDGIKLTN